MRGRGEKNEGIERQAGRNPDSYLRNKKGTKNFHQRDYFI
jgi:hypothetical protein